MTDDIENESPDISTDGNDEFEEITSEEVDRVLETLETLTESVTSENIRTYLENAANNIYELIYDESDEVEDDEAEEEAVDTEEAEMVDDKIADEAA